MITEINLPSPGIAQEYVESLETGAYPFCRMDERSLLIKED